MDTFFEEYGSVIAAVLVAAAAIGIALWLFVSSSSPIRQAVVNVEYQMTGEQITTESYEGNDTN